VEYRPLNLDLSSQKSVRAAADEIMSWSDVPTIDIIVNSAGIMNIPERTINEDGIEMHFATNHIGHFLFTCLVSPKLLEAAGSGVKGATRVVNVSSLSHVTSGMRWSYMSFEKRNKDLPKEEQPSYDTYRGWGLEDVEDKSYIPMEAYNQSKVAGLLFSIAMNKRVYDNHGILSFAVHLGVIATELGRNSPPEVIEGIQGMIKAGMLDVKTLGAGAATSLVAAVDPKLEVGKTKNGLENYGVYLVDCQISDKACARAESSDEADKLWTLSEEMVKEKFIW
jgi:NAD(P)-dependent dehydrogenase (short-subunit alcohol dehydrogenase family)